MDIDDEVNHVYDVLEFAESTKLQLAQGGIKSFQDLLNAYEILSIGKVGKVKLYCQEELSQFIRWTDFFQKKNNRKPDICRELTEDVLKDFQNSSVEILLCGAKEIDTAARRRSYYQSVVVNSLNDAELAGQPNYWQNVVTSAIDNANSTSNADSEPKKGKQIQELSSFDPFTFSHMFLYYRS